MSSAGSAQLYTDETDNGIYLSADTPISADIARYDYSSACIYYSSACVLEYRPEHYLRAYVDG